MLVLRISFLLIKISFLSFYNMMFIFECSLKIFFGNQELKNRVDTSVISFKSPYTVLVSCYGFDSKIKRNLDSFYIHYDLIIMFCSTYYYLLGHYIEGFFYRVFLKCDYLTPLQKLFDD